MLTIKQITEDTDKVIRGLEKKHFANAKETIAQVIELNDKRRNAQNQLDRNLAEVNSISKNIGLLMKEGKKEEAETAKARVAEIKEVSKSLQAEMDQAAEDMQNLLYTIPNVPYDEVPEGVGAEDNEVVKMGGMETELPKDALPHWELAKKYDLIDKWELAQGAMQKVNKARIAKGQSIDNEKPDKETAKAAEDKKPPSTPDNSQANI